jgi:hypothetical protein
MNTTTTKTSRRDNGASEQSRGKLAKASGAIDGAARQPLTEWQLLFGRRQRLLDEWEQMGCCGGANVLRRAARLGARLGELERRADERWWRLMRSATAVRTLVVWAPMPEGVES